MCVSPTMGDVSETKSALFFGSRAMKITNTAYVNVEVRVNTTIPWLCSLSSMANSLFRFRASPDLWEGSLLNYLIRGEWAVMRYNRGKVFITLSVYLIPERAANSQISLVTRFLMGLVSLSLHNFLSPCVTTHLFNFWFEKYSWIYMYLNTISWPFFPGWLQEAQRGFVQDCWHERYCLLNVIKPSVFL